MTGAVGFGGANRSRALVIGAALALALALSGCGATPGRAASSAEDQASPPTSTSPSPATPTEGILWLAVLRTAPSPDALDAATARLAPELGGALTVSPATCFERLPASIEGYLLGVTASSREELVRIVSGAGLVAATVVRTRSACVD